MRAALLSGHGFRNISSCASSCGTTAIARLYLTNIADIRWRSKQDELTTEKRLRRARPNLELTAASRNPATPVVVMFNRVGSKAPRYGSQTNASARSGFEQPHGQRTAYLPGATEAQASDSAPGPVVPPANGSDLPAASREQAAVSADAVRLFSTHAAFSQPNRTRQT